MRWQLINLTFFTYFYVITVTRSKKSHVFLTYFVLKKSHVFEFGTIGNTDSAKMLLIVQGRQTVLF